LHGHLQVSPDEGIAVPSRRDKDKGKQGDSPSLIPADAPFGAVPERSKPSPKPDPEPDPKADPKVKRQLFGRKKREEAAAVDPFPEPPRLEEVAKDPWAADAPPKRPARRRPLVTPWAPQSTEGGPLPWELEESKADEPDAEQPAAETPKADEPDALPVVASPVMPQPPQASTWSRPPVTVPDPDENELEFVFSGRESTPARAAATTTTTTTVERTGPNGRKISRSTAIALAVLLALIAGVVAYALLSSDDDPPASTAPPASVATSTAPSTAPTSDPILLSEECLNGFQYAEANPEPTNVTRTADLCPTVAQWLEAAKRFPAAIGASSASDVGADDVQRICASAPQSAMCRDAQKTGVLGGEGTAQPSAVASSAASPPARAPTNATPTSIASE
jgi:hypothetical protein